MRDSPEKSGGRYAILFAGDAFRNHLNDLELCYRMLVGSYGFEADEIFVLFHDGTRGENGGPFTDPDTGAMRKWPGDGSDFQIVPTGMGSRAAFREVLAVLNARLQPDDLIFMHIEGHGGNDPTSPQGPYLCAFAQDATDSRRYFAAQLQEDLAALASFRALVVLMNQCYAGGFTAAVLAGSTAAATSIACAASGDDLAHATSDMLWNDFSLRWIEAQMRQRVDGTKLSGRPHTDGHGACGAREAFEYASDRSEGLDTPNYASTPQPAGDEIVLGVLAPLAGVQCPGGSL